MTPARIALHALALGVLSLSLAISASAVTAPEASQVAYELPLQTFDMRSFRSPVVDSDRARAEAALTRAYSGTWAVYSWNPQSRTPSEMYGSGVDVAASLTSAERVRSVAEGVIEENPDAFRANLAGLRFNVVTSAPPVTDSPDGIRRPGKWAAHFQQVYHGIDVVGGEVHLTFTDTGRLFALGSTYYQDLSVDWTPSLTSEQAQVIARDALPFDPETDSVEDAARLLVLPVPLSVDAVEDHLVWEVRVRTAEPLGVWITRVDAQNGEILQRTNGVSFVNYLGNDVGQVERTSYCNAPAQETFPYAFASVLTVGDTYADANGYWSVGYAGNASNTLFTRLLSPYVDVRNAQGPWAAIFATILPGVPFQANFNDSNSRADERDVYRSVQDLHDFFQSFAPGFGFTNQVVTANVNINNTCNAYFDGVSINFYMAGNGCGNTGRAMDIVAHEYGHGVQQAIIGGGLEGNEGLGEGNGDVTAFLMTMSSLIGRGFYDCTDDGGIRECNNTLRYPGDVVGQEIHDAGRVIAGFHWDAMQDQIADYGIWGRYSAAWDWHWGRVLQRPMDQPAQVLATFIANDDDGNLTNGTPQFNSYCLAATNHGFACPGANLPLTAGGCDTYYQSPQGYTLNQTTNYWTVAGVSPAVGDDKDMSVYTPGYVTLLASSVGTVGTDFVVGDFNHNPQGVYQPWVSYGGTTTPYVTEWDSGADQISIGTDINGSVGGEVGSCGVVRIWDVFLSAGSTYSFGLLNDGGNADMRLSLFRNPAAAPYWAGRSAAVLELEAGNSQLFTAPASDWYGVVVFNNSQGTTSFGSYTLRVENAPTVMAAGECRSWNTVPKGFSFTQPFVYWTGVAVNPSGSDDKDIAVYGDPAGAGTPLASSTGVVGTDFIVGDFNYNPGGAYYPRISYGSPTASWVTEWESGQDAIYVGTDVNGTVGGTAGGCGLIQVYDTFLDEGQSYRFLLLTSGAANIRLAFFRNPSGGPYWGGRNSAEFEVGHAEGRTYTAPESGWYGVVVFNNSPGSPSGSYTLQLRDFPALLVDAECDPLSVVPQIFRIVQSTPNWTAVAINPTGADDKDVWLFDNPDGIGDPIAYSAGIEGTDFVIGDFNHNALGTYYPMATYGNSPQNYVLQWDSGPDILPLGENVVGEVGGTDGACNLIKVWDVFLEAGTSYPVVIAAEGDADIRASLFRNPESLPYWVGRAQAEFELLGDGIPYEYVAPASDYYGIVVFNASPDSPAGSYTLLIDAPTTGVEEEAVAGEAGVTFQNPYLAGSRIVLRAAADGVPTQVGIYNVQGRLVRSLLNESIGRAGRELTWNGRADSGVRVSAGLYFVHAQIGPMLVNRTLLMLR